LNFRTHLEGIGADAEPPMIILHGCNSIILVEKNLEEIAIFLLLNKRFDLVEEP
jgi:hypothetical protein